MKNLKVKYKLMISFSIVVLLLIACVIVGITNLRNVQKQVESFYNGPYAVRASANIVRANFEAMQKSVYRSIASTDPAVMQESFDQVDIAVKTIGANVPIVKENFSGDTAVITRFQDALTELAPHRETVMKLAKESKKTEAIAHMETYNIQIIRRAAAELESIITFANNEGSALIANIKSVEVLSVMFMLIMLIVSVLFSIILCLYITRSITSPLIEIERAAKEISEGNLKSTVLTYESKDEMGSLAGSLREIILVLGEYVSEIGVNMKALASGDLTVETPMDFKGDFVELKENITELLGSLNTTMTQINQSSEQVASGSEQVSSGAQELSQGTTQQASSIEELAATVNEISDQIKGTASNAQQANTKASDVGLEAAESNRRMQDMLSAMSDISTSSSEISKIIKTIEDIAFQTNILALNAAVEAARAGAAGKGFAVVADEVRNLASKSAEASKNTAVLIESSMKAVNNGTKIADETARSLNAVVDGVKDVAITIDKISLASNIQAQSVMQVTQGIDQISSVVQTNSATAEESAAASEELSSQAQMLKNLVGRFQIKNSGRQTFNTQSKHKEYFEAEMDYENFGGKY